MCNMQLSAVNDRKERKGTYMYVSWSLTGLLRGNMVACGVRGALIKIHANTNCTYGKGGAGGDNS